MRTHSRRLDLPTALIAGLALVTAACGNEATSPPRQEPAAGATPANGSGTAPGATGDTVLDVVETTLSSQNATAEWDGNILRVSLDGSADAAAAHTPCLMLTSFLEDGQRAVLVFDDGPLPCEDR